MAARTYKIIEVDILAHIIAYVFIAALILSGLGLIVLIANFFYYRKWRSNKVKVYYDDNDHRKRYYIVSRPHGPYPVGYPKERIIKDMEEFERLRRSQKEKTKNHNIVHAKTKKSLFEILMMTPAEYKEYRQREKEKKNAK